MRSTGIFSILLFCLPLLSWAEAQWVTVAEPFLELHTGPGRGYPVTHVAERGESVQVLKRRTSWYRIETERGQQGWIRKSALAATLNHDGSPIALNLNSRQQFQDRRWESGFTTGDFDGADLVGGFVSWHFTPNLAIKLDAAQALGEFSDSRLLEIGLVHEPFPEWRLSPYFRLAGGMIDTTPNATLVSTEDRLDQTAVVAAGMRYTLGRRFIVRAEYSNHLILTGRDDNQEVPSWRIALSAFF